MRRNGSRSRLYGRGCVIVIVTGNRCINGKKEIGMVLGMTHCLNLFVVFVCSIGRADICHAQQRWLFGGNERGLAVMSVVVCLLFFVQCQSLCMLHVLFYIFFCSCFLSVAILFVPDSRFSLTVYVLSSACRVNEGWVSVVYLFSFVTVGTFVGYSTAINGNNNHRITVTYKVNTT